MASSVVTCSGASFIDSGKSLVGDTKFLLDEPGNIRNPAMSPERSLDSIHCYTSLVCHSPFTIHCQSTIFTFCTQRV